MCTEVPLGTTEIRLRLILQSLYLYQIHILIQEYLDMYMSLSQTYTYRISYRSYRASMCTEVTEIRLRLILQSLYLYYKVYTCSEVPVGTTQIHYTEIPVGTTGLIIILQNLYLYYGYERTRRYYRDFTCTKVPIGTTEQIQRYP